MVYNGPSVVPTGSIAQADRQHIAWSYSGILATGPAVFTSRRLLILKPAA